MNMLETEAGATGCRLFVGGSAATVQGERENMNGDRCYTAAHPPQAWPRDMSRTSILLDSGAFTDPPGKRLHPEAALDRQIAWERKASLMWEQTVMSYAIASYDLLIDETWVAGKREKRRWSVKDADRAVLETVQAAQYVAARRHDLSPRRLVLGVQGVDPLQYEDCTREVLRHAEPGDWIGLGGWCILGRFTTWLPVFWATMHRVIPLIAQAGITHVHLYGVLYQQAIGGLVWLCDQHGIEVSNDSAAPILATTRRDHKRSGVRASYWRDNAEWWVRAMNEIRHSRHYKAPPVVEAARQMEFIA